MALVPGQTAQDLQAAIDKVLSLIKNDDGKSLSQGSARSTPAEAINSKLSAVGRLQFPSDRPKYFTEIRISQYNRDTLHTVGKLNLNNQIILPLPLQLINGHQVKYDEQDLGLAGALIDGFGALSAGSIFGGLGLDALKLAASSVAGGQPQNTPSFAQVFGSALAGMRVSGYTPNEYTTVLLHGPQYKKHVLKWKFSANDFQESVELRKIFWVLNNSMAPGLYLGGFLFTFPSIFEIAYYPNPGYLYKFKPAVCEAMLVNYSGGGAPAFYRDAQGESGGLASFRPTDEQFGEQHASANKRGVPTSTDNAPESIEVEMHMLELEYWITGDFKDTNDPYDGYAGARTGGYWGTGTSNPGPGSGSTGSW